MAWIGKTGAAVAAVAAAACVLALRAPGVRVIELPAGTLELNAPMVVEGPARVEGSPRGSVIRAAADFHGRGLIEVHGHDVTLSGFDVEGNRNVLAVPAGLPPSNRTFAQFTAANGILAEDCAGIRIARLRLRNIAGFAVLATRSRDIGIDHVEVTESGSRDGQGHNNTTGGILLEEGTAHFRVTGCRFRDVLGNGVWTHSLYTSPRNARGVFADNRFDSIGRDALQVGHATEVRVERNRGTRIGRPMDYVDVEGRAIPVAVDTAGNVDRSFYEDNVFSEVNGKCFDLDGFHDGAVRGNVCVNRLGAEAYPMGGYGVVMNNTNPDMQSRHVAIEYNRIEGAKFGGVFAIGENNVVRGNRLLNLNMAHCNEEAARFGCYYAPGQPDMLRVGIYLGSGAERPAPARGNLVERNEVTGWMMASRCIGAAPGIRPEWNTVRWNVCR